MRLELYLIAKMNNIAKKLKAAGSPKVGELAWELWTNLSGGHIKTEAAIKLYRKAGYKAFQGYPLDPCSSNPVEILVGELEGNYSNLEKAVENLKAIVNKFNEVEIHLQDGKVISNVRSVGSWGLGVFYSHSANAEYFDKSFHIRELKKIIIK